LSIAHRDEATTVGGVIARTSTLLDQFSLLLLGEKH
jgi:hypothetical protein